MFKHKYIKYFIVMCFNIYILALLPQTSITQFLTYDVDDYQVPMFINMGLSRDFSGIMGNTGDLT